MCNLMLLVLVQFASVWGENEEIIYTYTAYDDQDCGNSAVLVQETVDSDVETCERQCNDEPACASFSFSNEISADATCRLFKEEGCEVAENTLFDHFVKERIIDLSWRSVSFVKDYYHYVPERIIDGVWDDGIMSKQHCAHSGSSNGPWWQMDLPRGVQISKIRILNRKSYHERLNGFDLTLDGEVCAAEIPLGISEAKIVDVKCPSGKKTASQLRVFKRYKDYLNFCEFAVFGTVPARGFKGCYGVSNSQVNEFQLSSAHSMELCRASAIGSGSKYYALAGFRSPRPQYVAYDNAPGCEPENDITTKEECSIASRYLNNKESVSKNSWSNIAKGCFINSESSTYFNTHTGTKGHSSYKSICRTPGWTEKPEIYCLIFESTAAMNKYPDFECKDETLYDYPVGKRLKAAVYETSAYSDFEKDLYSGVTQFKVKFQPTSAQAPEGFVVDNGGVYAEKDGHSFGWDYPLLGHVKDQGTTGDSMIDTLIQPTLDMPKPEYLGCYNTQGWLTIHSTREQPYVSVKDCRLIALMRKQRYFGMEYPQGTGTVGWAKCFTFDSHTAVLVGDSDCEHEVHEGYRLGNSYRMAIYTTAFAPHGQPPASTSKSWRYLFMQTATQSSTAYSGAAARAIDENKAHNFWSGASCTHTSSTVKPWWSVTLPANKKLDKIRITTRADGDNPPFYNFDVLIDGVLCANGDYNMLTRGRIVLPLECADGRESGNTLKIAVTDETQKSLIICEVEVHMEGGEHVYMLELPEDVPYWTRHTQQRCQGDDNWTGAKNNLDECKAACEGFKYMVFVSRGDKKCACQNDCTVIDDDVSDLYTNNVSTITQVTNFHGSFRACQTQCIFNSECLSVRYCTNPGGVPECFWSNGFEGIPVEGDCKESRSARKPENKPLYPAQCKYLKTRKECCEYREAQFNIGFSGEPCQPAAEGALFEGSNVCYAQSMVDYSFSRSGTKEYTIQGDCSILRDKPPRYAVQTPFCHGLYELITTKADCDFALKNLDNSIADDGATQGSWSDWQTGCFVHSNGNAAYFNTGGIYRTNTDMTGLNSNVGQGTAVAVCRLKSEPPGSLKLVGVAKQDVGYTYSYDGVYNGGVHNECGGPMLDFRGAWCAVTTAFTADTYLAIDVGSIELVPGIITQGRYDSDQWVQYYQLFHSTDHSTWTDLGNFYGNTDRITKVRHQFSSPLLARFIKLKPLRYYSHTSMRFGLMDTPPRDCSFSLHTANRESNADLNAGGYPATHANCQNYMGARYDFDSTTGTPQENCEAWCLALQDCTGYYVYDSGRCCPIVKTPPFKTVVKSDVNYYELTCATRENEHVFNRIARRWSRWYDQDNPTDDYEEIRRIPDHPCNGDFPLAAECQTLDGREASSTGDSFLLPCGIRGLICTKATNNGVACQDYKVRYLCPQGMPHSSCTEGYSFTEHIQCPLFTLNPDTDPYCIVDVTDAEEVCRRTPNCKFIASTTDSTWLSTHGVDSVMLGKGTHQSDADCTVCRYFGKRTGEKATGLKEITWDFEDGSMQGLETVTGDCGVQPQRHQTPLYASGQYWNNFHGKKFHINSYQELRAGGDQVAPRYSPNALCRLADRTHAFTVTPLTSITFDHAGYFNVRLRECGSGKELFVKRVNHQNRQMNRFRINPYHMGAALGKHVYLEFDDDRTDHYMVIDNIRVYGVSLEGSCEDVAAPTWNLAVPNGHYLVSSYYCDSGAGAETWGCKVEGVSHELQPGKVEQCTADNFEGLRRDQRIVVEDERLSVQGSTESGCSALNSLKVTTVPRCPLPADGSVEKGTMTGTPTNERFYPSFVDFECESGYILVGESASCNIHGQWDYPRCFKECESGFTNDAGYTMCINQNECEDGTHNCDASTDCVDTEGDYACACRPPDYMFYEGNIMGGPGDVCTSNNRLDSLRVETHNSALRVYFVDEMIYDKFRINMHQWNPSKTVATQMHGYPKDDVLKTEEVQAKYLPPGTPYLATITPFYEGAYDESREIGITKNTKCGCSYSSFGSTNEQTGSPMNVIASQDRGRISLQWTDNSICEEAFSFIRTDPNSTMVQESAFVDDYYYTTSQKCGVTHKPSAVQDDIQESSLKLGQVRQWCGRAVASVAEGDNYVSDKGCSPPVSIKWEAIVEGAVMLEPMAGGLPVEGVEVVWTLGADGQGRVGGTLLTNKEGKFFLHILTDTLINEEEELVLRFSKQTGATKHKFLCHGMFPCSTTSAFIRHMTFGNVIDVIDDTSVPFRGTVSIKGTEHRELPNGCPLFDVEVCLHDPNTGSQFACAQTNPQGEYEIPAVIGTKATPKFFYKQHTFEAVDNSVSDVHVIGAQLIEFVDYYDTSTETLKIDVVGGKCGWMLGISSIDLSRASCPTWSKRLEMTAQRQLFTVPAAELEVGIAMVEDADRVNVYAEITHYFSAALGSRRAFDVDLSAVETTEEEEELDTLSADENPRHVLFEYHPQPFLSLELEGSPTETDCAEKPYVLKRDAWVTATVGAVEKFGHGIRDCDWIEGDVVVTNHLGEKTRAIESLRALNVLPEEQLVGLGVCRDIPCRIPIKHDNEPVQDDQAQCGDWVLFASSWSESVTESENPILEQGMMALGQFTFDEDKPYTHSQVLLECGGKTKPTVSALFDFSDLQQKTDTRNRISDQNIHFLSESGFNVDTFLSECDHTKAGSACPNQVNVLRDTFTDEADVTQPRPHYLDGDVKYSFETATAAADACVSTGFDRLCTVEEIDSFETCRRGWLQSVPEEPDAVCQTFTSSEYNDEGGKGNKCGECPNGSELLSTGGTGSAKGCSLPSGHTLSETSELVSTMCYCDGDPVIDGAVTSCSDFNTYTEGGGTDSHAGVAFSWAACAEPELTEQEPTYEMGWFMSAEREGCGAAGYNKVEAESSAGAYCCSTSGKLEGLFRTKPNDPQCGTAAADGEEVWSRVWVRRVHSLTSSERKPANQWSLPRNCQLDTEVMRDMGTPENARAELRLFTGAPQQNPAALDSDHPHTKLFRATMAIPHQPIFDLSVMVVVTGDVVISEYGSVPVPEYKPLVVLRDPPGGLSQNKLYRAGATITMETKEMESNTGLYTDSYVGVTLPTVGMTSCYQFGAGGGGGLAGPLFFMGMDMCNDMIEFDGSLGAEFETDNGIRSNYNFNEAEQGVETEWTFSTSADPILAGQKSDVFLIPSLNIIFTETLEISWDPDVCKATSETKMKYSIARVPEKAAFSFLSYEDIRLKEIPQLEALRQDALTNDKADEAAKFLEGVEGFRKMLSDHEDVLVQAANGQLKPVTGLVPAAFIDGSRLSPGATRLDGTKAGMDDRDWLQNVYTIKFEGGGALYEYSEGQHELYDSRTDVSPATFSDSKVGFVAQSELAVLGAGFKFDTNIGAHLSSRKEHTKDKITDGADDGYMSVVFGDPDEFDIFDVQIFRDPTYNTYVFRTTSGRSMCPHETNTVAREQPELLIVRQPNGPVLPDMAAVFELRLLNNAERDASIDAGNSMLRTGYLELEVRHTTNPDGLTINGPVKPSSFQLLGQEATSVTLEVFRGPEKYEYEPVTLRFGSTCEALTYAEVDLRVAYLEYCPTAEMAGELHDAKSFLMNQQTGDELRVTVRNPSGTTQLWANSTRLEGVYLEYREKGALVFKPCLNKEGKRINAVPKESEFGFASVFWSPRTLQDGEYELRFRTACKPVPGLEPPPGLNEAFSEVISGHIDRTPPTMFGLPEPGDQEYIPGDKIQVTFGEPILCSRPFRFRVSLEIAGLSRKLNERNLQIICGDGGHTIRVNLPADLPYKDVSGKDAMLTISQVEDVNLNEIRFPVTHNFKFAVYEMLEPPVIIEDLVLDVPFEAGMDDTTSEVFKSTSVALAEDVSTLLECEPSRIEVKLIKSVGGGSKISVTLEILPSTKPAPAAEPVVKVKEEVFEPTIVEVLVAMTFEKELSEDEQGEVCGAAVEAIEADKGISGTKCAMVLTNAPGGRRRRRRSLLSVSYDVQLDIVVNDADQLATVTAFKSSSEVLNSITDAVATKDVGLSTNTTTSIVVDAPPLPVDKPAVDIIVPSTNLAAMLKTKVESGEASQAGGTYLSYVNVYESNMTMGKLNVESEPETGKVKVGEGEELVETNQMITDFSEYIGLFMVMHTLFLVVLILLAGATCGFLVYDKKFGDDDNNANSNTGKLAPDASTKRSLTKRRGKAARNTVIPVESPLTTAAITPTFNNTGIQRKASQTRRNTRRDKNKASKNLVVKPKPVLAGMCAESTFDEVHELVVDKKHDVNNGNPLLHATRNPDHRIAALLIKHKADVHACNHELASPVYIAADHGHLNTVQLLLEAGAKVDHENEDGWTPLINSAYEGHHNVVEHLVKANADLNKQTGFGTTALMNASRKGNVETVRFLLDSRADPLLEDKAGKTALSLAEAQGKKGCADLVKAALG